MTTIEGHSGRGPLTVTPPAAAVTCALAGLGSLLLLLRPGEEVGYALAIPFGMLIVAVSVYRIEWGVMILLAMNLLFDQTSTSTSIPYHIPLNRDPLVSDAGITILTPFEAHLVFLLLVWFVGFALNRGMHLAPVPLKGGLLAYTGFLAIGVVQGIAGGAPVTRILWEIRSLALLPVLFFFMPQVIRTRRDLSAVLWISGICLSLKALQGAALFASLGFSFGHWPNVYDVLTANQFDAMLFIGIFALIAGLTAFSVKGRLRTFLLACLPVLVLGFIAGNRRAAYAATVVCMAVFPFLLPAERRRKVLVAAVPLLVLLVVYTAAFWNSYSRLGAVAQALKGTIVRDAEVAGSRNYSSNLYREYENYNLASTFRRAPAVGIGFGKTFDTPMLLWVNFGFSTLIPHNQILWTAAKTGILGVLFFWGFTNAVLAYGGTLLRRGSDPLFGAVCVMALLTLVSFLVGAFVDYQLSVTRNMVFLGSLLGLLPVVARLSTTTESESSDRNPAPSSVGGV
jgi:hypothetical protein